MRPAAGQHGSGATAGAHQRQRQPCPGAGCRVSGDGVPAGGRCRPGTGGAAAAAEHSGELGAGHGCTARRSWVLGVCTACQPMCLNHDRQHPAAPACLCPHRVRPSLMFLTDTGQARRGLLACGLQVRHGAGRPSAEPALPRSAAQGRLILLRGKLLLRGSAGRPLRQHAASILFQRSAIIWAASITCTFCLSWGCSGLRPTANLSSLSPMHSPLSVNCPLPVLPFNWWCLLLFFGVASLANPFHCALELPFSCL